MRCWVTSLAPALAAAMARNASPEGVQDQRVTRLIRIKEVQHRVGLGRSTIYRWMAEGKFPKPVQLGGSTVAWSEGEVDRWISSRLTR